MSLEPQYNPQHFETKIYEFWESQNAFKPSGGKRDTFSMAVPPPNANGNPTPWARADLGHRGYYVSASSVKRGLCAVCARGGSRRF